MPSQAPLMADWSAGEFSPLADGRVDISRYASGCRLLENFLPSVIGPAIRRPGAHFVASARYPDKLAVLLPFQYSKEQAYSIEIGDLYVRFYRNDGPLLETAKAITAATQANPIVLTITGHGYSNGDDFETSGVSGMTQLNGRRFRVANKTTNTVELTDMHNVNINGTGYSAYVSGGTASRVYTVSAPYIEADLAGLKFAQSADVLYLTHQEYVPRKLARYPTRWDIAQVDFQDGPYLPMNGGQATLGPSATTGAGITISSTTTKAATGMAAGSGGAIRVTCANHGWKTGDKVDVAATVGTTEANGTWSAIRVNANAFELAGSTFVTTWGSGGTITPHIFETHDTGRLVRIQHSTTWGYAKITAVASPVSVTADVLSAFGGTGQVANWRLGLFSTDGGFPTCVTFYDGRLFFGGCPLIPNRLDGSRSSDYENFSPSDPDGVVVGDHAVAYPLDSGDVNNIIWMKDDEKGLLVGTNGGEWLIRASTTGGSLDATATPKVSRSTTFGSYEGSQPVRTGKDLIFVQRKQKKLRNLSYSYADDGFGAGDLTLIADHMGKAGLGQLAFQSEPQGWVWATRGDGQVPVLNYNKDEDKIGLSRQIFGGYSDLARKTRAKVESICSIPDPNDARDEIWAIVKRTINGKVERYIELVDAGWERGDDQWKAFYADSGLVFDGAIAQTLQPGAGADQKGATVPFTSGAAAFSVGDVGRRITYRYFDPSLVDPDFPADLGKWLTAKALITAYTSSTIVSAKILSAFPSLDLIPASGWRLTAQILTNLWHLEGETLSLNVEGGTHPDVVVTGGQVTLQRPASYAVAGLACPARLQTLRIEAGSANGTAQGKKKRIEEVVVRVVQTLGGEAGPNFNELGRLAHREPKVPMGTAPDISDSDRTIKWEGGYETDGRIAIQQAAPFPMTVQAILPQVTTYD